MELHLSIIGVMFVVLAVAHVGFPRYFRWSTELPRLSVINREMMVIHFVFIAIILLLMGLLCLTSASDLVHTELGRRVSLGMGIFWLVRLAVQFFGYSSTLWRGKMFETSIHIVFALSWAYFSVVFLLIALH
ncbi:MAG: hypothetical protein JSS89_04170 [Bacteroidetes bacterium]|nr:hypothetical protein [Bacteroidota bacterium]